MGCGKTSVGRRLAALTGYRFADTDERIVEIAGRSIPEIFAQEGEERFRDYERQALESFVGAFGLVLATGGGIVVREENRALLRQIGFVAWLDSDPDVLFERAMRSGKRPLLNTPDPRQSFDTLLAARRNIYEAVCDVHIDSTHMTHDQAAHAVLAGARKAQNYSRLD